MSRWRSRRSWVPRRVVPILILLSSMLGVGPAAADEPVFVDRHDPAVFPPPSARVTSIYAGALTTVGWYGLSLSASYLWPDNAMSRDLRIPVAGPWMALGDIGCADDDPDCGDILVFARAASLVLDGIGQLGGLAVMTEGLLLPTREAPRLQSRRTLRPRARSASVTMHPTFALTGRKFSIGVLGRF